MTHQVVFHEADDRQAMRIALTADPATVARFRSSAFHNLGAAPHGQIKPAGVPHSHWFLQCESATYLLFEFWTQNRDAITSGIRRTLDACAEEGLILTLVDHEGRAIESL